MQISDLGSLEGSESFEMDGRLRSDGRLGRDGRLRTYGRLRVSRPGKLRRLGELRRDGTRQPITLDALRGRRVLFVFVVSDFNGNLYAI